MIATTDQVSHYLLEAYIALAEVYDGLFSVGGAEMRRGMAGISKLANRYAMMYPIGKPAARLKMPFVEAMAKGAGVDRA